MARDPAPAPAISVIIPAYGVAPYIAETLDSVLAQTFSELEILVVNDASPDTATLEAALKPYRDRIRYWRLPLNGGPAAARNTAVRQARGAYLAFLDGDDVWLADSLAAHMQVLRERPELDLLYGDLEYFGDSPEAGRRFLEMWPSRGPVTAEALLAQTCAVPTSATVARRTAVLEAGLFDERFRYAEDFDLWVRMSLRGCRLGYHERLVARRRVHGGALTADTAAHRRTLLEVLEKLRGEAGISQEALRILDRQSRRVTYLLHSAEAKQALQRGEYRVAAAHLETAAGAVPTVKIRALRWSLACSPRATRALAGAWSARGKPAGPQASEVAAGRRFAFGKNWQRFLAVLDEERIRAAEQSLAGMLGVRDLTGRSFLDVGSGSGLFSLAARRLGARVHSFDYDPQSVACTAELRRRYFPEDAHWTVEAGSVLDAPYLRKLGAFDVVYSWGVLHHTGAMWQALENVAGLVAPGGTLFLAIYNDQGSASRRWRWVKKTYNRLPRGLRWPLLLAALVYLNWWRLPGALLHPGRFRRPAPVRGMSWWRDLVDWVGGYPFEAARPEEIFDFYRGRGFALARLRTDRGLGCNEFVLLRGAGRAAAAGRSPIS